MVVVVALVKDVRARFGLLSFFLTLFIFIFLYSRALSLSLTLFLLIWTFFASDKVFSVFLQ